MVDSDWLIPDVNAGYNVDSLTGVLAKSFGNMMVFPRYDSDISFVHPGCDSEGSNDVFNLNCGYVDLDDDVSATLLVTSPEPFFGGSFWGQLVYGGDYSAVQVYGVGDFTQPAIGDIVTVSGEYEEYRGQSEIVIFGEDDISVDSSSNDVTLRSSTPARSTRHTKARSLPSLRSSSHRTATARTSGTTLSRAARSSRSTRPSSTATKPSSRRPLGRAPSRT